MAELGGIAEKRPPANRIPQAARFDLAFHHEAHAALAPVGGMGMSADGKAGPGWRWSVFPGFLMSEVILDWRCLPEPL